MQVFNASGLSSALVFFAAIGQKLHAARAGTYALSRADHDLILNYSVVLRQFALDLGFYGVAEAAAELHKLVNSIAIEQSPVLESDTIHNIHSALDNLVRSIVNELKVKKIFALSIKEQDLFEPAEPLFGSEVDDAFPGRSAEDIEEAAKCLSFGRSTAAVFHLMRVLESAMTVIARKIGAEVVDRNRKGLSWGVVAKNMKEIIDRMPADEQVKWYRVQSQLVVVNRAWRVPTNHPKETYTLEQAYDVFNATRSFMMELAPLASADSPRAYQSLLQFNQRRSPEQL